MSLPTLSLHNLVASSRRSNTLYASVERCLDIVGYIPVINEIGGAFRAGLAIVQVAHGIAMAFFATAKHLSHIASEEPSYPTTPLDTDRFMAKQARDLIKNGLFNIFRASVETSGPLGGIICLVFDSVKSNFSATLLRNTYGQCVTNPEIHRPFLAQLI